MVMVNVWNFLSTRVRTISHRAEAKTFPEFRFSYLAFAFPGADINQKNVYDYTPLNYADSNSRGHSPIYNTPQEYVRFLSALLPNW